MNLCVFNLIFVSKLGVRLVSSQLMAYLNSHNLLPLEQSAYRQHHSTQKAALKIACDSFDARRATVLALLDLSAAFDAVDHTILLQWLKVTYDVCDTVLRWIQSFLSGCSRSVAGNFSGQQAIYLALTRRVPQGFVQGPLMFNLYTANITNIARAFSGHVLYYVDDLQIYTRCTIDEAPAPLMRLFSCIKTIYKKLS